MAETITRILVPVDFSVHSDRAVRYAMELAGKVGARVELLHVVENPVVSGAWSSEIYVANLPELLESLMADANRRLEMVKTATAREGIEVGTCVVSGTPAHMILDEARTGRFDLIVMGTHGRTGLSHVLMGSVAERVVRRAFCPVLTLRAAPPVSEATSAKAAHAAV